MDPILFQQEIEKARRDYLTKIDNVPVAALVWGPSPTSSDPVGQTRLALRDELRRRGHYAAFSEDLYDPTSTRSLFAQQVAQAEAFDIVFSIPHSPGSIAEIHDFARIPGLSRKVFGFVDSAFDGGYSYKSLVAAESNASCKIQVYDRAQLPKCIIDVALDQIARLQEFFYIMGRR
jgi:hypothetical protein